MTLLRLFILPILSLSPPCVGWTFTNYFQEFLTTETSAGPNGETFEVVDTVTLAATPTVDDPIAITTYTSNYHYNTHIQFEDVYLEQGQAEQIPITAIARDETFWSYSVIMTYTNLAGCHGPPTSVTTAPVRFPSEVNDVITPFSTSWTAETSTDGFLDGPMTETTVTVYIEETQIPEPIIGEWTRLLHQPEIYFDCERNYYFGDGDYSNCTDKPYKIGDTKIGGVYECSNGTFHWGLQVYQVLLIFLLAWMVLILIMGIFQSIVRFGDLMTGKKASRGLPIPFICIVPIVAFPLIGLHSDGFVARSEEDRALLAVQWRTTPLRKKVRLWLKYGFTRDYPPMLGTPPTPPQRRPQSIAAQSTIHEEPYEAPPPPYTRNETPPPPHPEVQQNPAAVPVSGTTVARPPSPPKYESD